MTDKMTKRIVVTNISVHGSGFAKTDDDETVFISNHIVEAVGVDRGDVFIARLIPNTKNTDAIPYKAVRLERMEGDGMTPDEVHEALLEFDVPVTASEAQISIAYLLRAHDEGKAVKIMAYTSPKVLACTKWSADMEIV